MKPPSLKALFFGLIPFVTFCFTVPLWDRVYPMVFGLPFNLFWLMMWTLLSPVCLWRAYRAEISRSTKSSGPESRGAE
jgi:Protein of unknown function (DUF3311)